MIYQSDNLRVDYLEDGIAEIQFDIQGSVNKLSHRVVMELQSAIAALAKETMLKGVILTSGKDAFIVGADITEFLGLFTEPREVLQAWLKEANGVFNALEDLPVPTVAAVKGFALGGGCETILATDLRVADTTARIGLPETKLGLIPGFGGTVRLPRLIGADNALEAIATGKDNKAKQALKLGLVDAVVAPEKLTEAALVMLKDAIAGKLDWRARRLQKQQPLALNQIESAMAFNTAKGFIAQKAGPHYPAPLAAVSVVEKAAPCSRDEAVAIESSAFIELAKGPVAEALVGVFMADQEVKRKAKTLAKQAAPATRASVIGAGIMGGGIAYQSASRGVPAVMKDISPKALDLGIREASKLLNKQLERGRIDGLKMGQILGHITPALSNDAITGSDIIVEAVVENPAIKAKVLPEVEQQVDDTTIIASNTSTISIDQLAESLQRPENFLGMHFFNPVHRMPLVEVIRGKQTSDKAVAKVVAYASQMGKTAIVVNDCPGFFVNRVLFPYFAGFTGLLADGADFQQIDKIMTRQFGWPMGPAYLLDVVGIDTAVHGAAVMAEGFPDRMGKPGKDAVDLLYEANRLGQKNGVGFYKYTVDRKGKPKQEPDPDIVEVLRPLGAEPRAFEAEAIIARIMIPMVIETVRCLEEGIVDSPAEADIALLYGIGFPPFRGGVFRYLEQMGLDQFVALADQYADLGPLYQVTDEMRERARTGRSYYAN